MKTENNVEKFARSLKERMEKKIIKLHNAPASNLKLKLRLLNQKLQSVLYGCIQKQKRYRGSSWSGYVWRDDVDVRQY